MSLSPWLWSLYGVPHKEDREWFLALSSTPYAVVGIMVQISTIAHDNNCFYGSLIILIRKEGGKIEGLWKLFLLKLIWAS